MKLIKPSSTDGTGKQTASPVPGAGEDFDKKLVAFKQRTHFIEKTTDPADGSCVTTALLELGFEQQLDLHGEEDAKDLIDRAFRRVVKERRGPLQ